MVTLNFNPMDAEFLTNILLEWLKKRVKNLSQDIWCQS